MIKVLVVDDSLFMRRLISDMLNSDAEITVVDTAKTGEEALKKVFDIKPDCITLDLVMPGWDGLTTLRHIMDQCPTPTIILSAYSQEEADITIECLKSGAVGFVLKPSGELSLDIDRVKEQLIREVKASAKVKTKRIKSLPAEETKSPGDRLTGKNKIVVIGASTGGPKTLEAVLPAIPTGFSAPILIIQHMPAISFTQSLAKHFNNICQLPVIVPEKNENIRAGRVYLAPGGFQTEICDFRFVICDLIKNQQSKIENILTPSIDMAMESAAKIYKANTLGIILSGMGNDGLQGMRAIKEAGGKTIAQDESSLIFGMPRVVIEAGYADRILPASRIGEFLISDCG